MAEAKLKTIKDFYGGMVRDEKSLVKGAAANIEELDIFTNADYFQAEQIFSTDSMPASTEVYSYCSDSAGTVYGYGKETAGNKVRIVSVATGGADNPGAFATLFTSADTDDLAYKISPVIFHRTTEAQSDYLYYLTKNSTTIKLWRYNITAGTEASVGTLTGLDGTDDRLSMKVMFGELIIANGKYMAKVDKDGTFTDTAFTLPNDWIAVDMIPVSDVCIIVSRYADKSVNYCKGYWWDLTATVQVDDSFSIPSGGPQWIVNHQENVIILCAINGQARFFQLSGAFPGAVPQELPGITLFNVALESDQQPVSSSKMVADKDKVLYFALNKTDKTGVYALGKLDSDKPRALILSKKFSTSTITNHVPTGLFILGPNYYGAFADNGTASTVRCESRNSPSRSASGVYESIVIDDNSPHSNKDFEGIYVTTQPMPASTDVNVSIATDYGSYAEIFRDDGTSFNTTSGVQGMFKPKASKQKKSAKVKLELVSSGTSSPKVTAIGIKLVSHSVPAPK